MSDSESEDEDFEWDPFTWLGFISFESWCNLSDQMLVIYYPKDAIREKFGSNEWTHLKALFYGSNLSHVEECGIHLIYANGFQCQQHEECQWKLCLKGCEINELPLIEFPYELSSLSLRECKNLESLPSTICELKSLTTLSCYGCSRLKSFPEIPPKGLENLRKLQLGGTTIQELPSSIRNLKGLQNLDLAYCSNLLSLPETICHLKSLAFLSCQGCSQLKSFPEIREVMENLRKLHLDGTAIQELPSSIQSLKGLQYLNLAYCRDLLSLPETICYLKSLAFLSCQGCSQLKSFPEIREVMENLRKLHLDGTAIQELPSSIQSLKGLQYLNLAYCRDLLSLPETICYLKSLAFLSCQGCSQLKSFPEIREDMENLRELYLDRTAIQELPSSIQSLKGLQYLNLAYCRDLLSLPETICYLKSLAFLYCQGCSQLKSFPEIREVMENLRKLHLDGTAIQELPSSIQSLKGLQYLNLAYCRDLLSLPETICYLKSLAFLSCQGCSQLKSFPEIREVMENLRKLHLDGTAIQELPSSIQSLKGLQYLNLAYCRDLLSLPETICYLKSLAFLSCQGCSQLKSFPEIREDMENLRELYLDRTAIQELPSSIQSLKGLQYLNLAYCRGLLSLPETICYLKSLAFLYCQGCSQLKCFPEIREVMENLRKLHLDGTAIQELPSSIQSLKGLQYLNLAYCRDLLSLPKTICYLKSLAFLSCWGCSQLKSFPDIWEVMENLRELYLDGTAIEELPTSIRSLKGLQRLTLSYCKNLVNLPDNIFNLRFLNYLNVNLCSKLDKFPQNLGNLQCLVSLQVAGFDSNHFSSLPAGIIQLSKLRILNLSHCQKLLQIPELPPTLRILDVHACPRLETSSSPSGFPGFSLCKCFKSAIKV